MHSNPLLKKIAVLTSGGDAPGMNAAIRAVVRTALGQGCEVWGIRRGYTGLLAGDFLPLGTRDVGHIIQQGGTMLGSSRSPEFKTDAGPARALEQLSGRNIEGLIVIGGNGSQAGAHALASRGFAVMGVASTIDNDVYGSEITIGSDTAINVALEAIDRLKVTASAFGRVFLIEVMGHHCGYLALMAGIAGGAESILIPEIEVKPDEIAREVLSAYQRGKAHAILVIAEGAAYNAEQLATYFRTHYKKLGFELRVTRLGHVQRGGAPSAFDRLLATRLSSAATEALLRGEKAKLTGLIHGKIALTPLSDVVSRRKTFELGLMKLAGMLAQ